MQCFCYKMVLTKNNKNNEDNHAYRIQGQVEKTLSFSCQKKDTTTNLIINDREWLLGQQTWNLLDAFIHKMRLFQSHNYETHS